MTVKTGAFLMAALALAACERQAADEASNASSADVGVAPASPAAAPTSTAMLPERIVGMWAVRAADCAGGATRVAIERGRLRFHESVATVTSVVDEGRGTVGVDVRQTGEGRSERRSWDLTLSDSGRTLTRVEAPYPDIVYTRCSKADAGETA